jgi:hypothetical protein
MIGAVNVLAKKNSSRIVVTAEHTATLQQFTGTLKTE